jgi:ubiquinone/menaquinone biosynthesis C-methylase UbiE
MTTANPARTYILGHDAREHDRLDLQGLLYRDITRDAFLRAGIQPGMRVLDLGCGSGDVSMLAAELVGPSGSVVGVDRDPGSVDRAQQRADADGVGNVRFVVADIGGADETAIAEAAGAGVEATPFDALVGRFILMHVTDPAAVLEKAARWVRPGGSVVMVESTMETLMAGDHSRPHSKLYGRIIRWKYAVVKRSGADVRAGLRLYETFASAGLPAPSTRLEAPVEGGPDSLYYRFVVESMRSMMPRAEVWDVIDFEREELPGLESRFRHEIVEGAGVVVGWPVFSAWCPVPEASLGDS